MTNINKEGWEIKTIKEVSSFVGDGDWIESKDQSEDGIRLIQTGNVGNGIFKDKGDKAKFISDETFDALGCTEIFAGDCLISRLPDPIGRACLLPNLDQKCITAVDCTILRFTEQIVPKYFVYYSQSTLYASRIISFSTGSTRKRISRKNLERIQIPLPPLPIQQRIVEELDEINAIISAKKQQLQKLDELAQSIFYDMFGDPVANEKGWEVKTLKELTTKLGSGATPRGGNQAYKDEGVSLIRSLNVHNNEFVYKDLAHIDDEQAKALNGVTIEENDILLNITGASVARSCIVPKEVLPARVNQHVCIIRPKDIVVSYLARLLTSTPYQVHLIALATSKAATREALPKNLVEGLKIILPPLPLQETFAARVSAIEEEKAAITASIERMQTLLDARMQEYFG